MDEIDYDSTGIELFGTPSTFHASKSKIPFSRQDDTFDNNGKAGRNRAAIVHQKENQMNVQKVTTNVEYKNDDLRMGRSLSKVQSLSSIRDIGCTNPMAYTLWHHPTLNEKHASKQEEGSIEHENWDLLNHLHSMNYHAQKSISAPTNYTPSNPRFNEKSHHDDDDDIDDNDDEWNTTSPLFVPLTTTTTDEVTATTRAVVWMDHTTTNTDALATRDSDLSTTTSIICPRRHSLPECISRPIAIRPLLSSSMSSS